MSIVINDGLNNNNNNDNNNNNNNNIQTVIFSDPESYFTPGELAKFNDPEGNPDFDADLLFNPAELNTLKELLTTVRGDYSYVHMGEDLARKYHLAPSTIRDWFNLFKKDSFRGFHEDKRGKWIRESYLERFDYTMAFKLRMRTSKSLSVDDMTFYVNQIMVPTDDAEAYNLLPVSRTVVYGWMKAHGARYDVVKKCYFTDRHDTPENVADRVGRYIPQKLDYSRREAVWAWILFDDKINGEALEDAKLRMQISDNSGLIYKIDDGKK